MQHSSGGLRSAPSALDEDTLVKIALQISKDEDERMRESLESKPEREELQVEEFGNCHLHNRYDRAFRSAKIADYHFSQEGTIGTVLHLYTATFQ
jgi:hypothetical protein